MGKGYRNRDDRDSETVLAKNSKPKKQKKARHPMPKWIVPTLVTVIAVIAVAAIVFGVLLNNGTFKRNNILVKSQQQSKYSVNQLAAQIMVWYSGWVQGQNAYYGTISTSAEYDQNTEFSYSWAYANVSQSDLKSVIEESGDWLEEMVALCDWGIKNNIPFSSEDEENAYSTFVSAFRSQAKSYYKYAYEVGFSNEEGVAEKYPYDYSSYVDFSSYPYFSGYLRNVFGNSIKSEDFRRAAAILTYASRVKTLKESEFWETLDATTIAEELKKNPGSYYSTEYLKYTADNAELAAKLEAATDADDFKKIIVADYIENNYYKQYSSLLAGAMLKKVTAETDKEFAELVAGLGLEVQDLTKPVEETPAEETEGDTENTDEAEGDTENTDETEDDTENTDEAETDGLTKKQSDWLFNKDRVAKDAEVVTEEDGTSTLLAIVEVTKDEAGNITAVKAAVKNYAVALSEEELAKLIEEVYHHLGLTEETEPTETADETEGDTETEGTEETETLEGWDDLVEKMESGANSELPSQSNAAYLSAADLDKDLEEVKKGLEEAEDKVTYMTGKNANTYSGTTIDNQKIDAAVKAVLFPEEGTVAEGLIQIIEAEDGESKHLIYVSKVETKEDTDQTLVTFYDYTASDYPTQFQQWLFENVSWDESAKTMTGGPAAGETFREETSDAAIAVYFVTGAIGLGEDVVRGGYASFDKEDDARAAKEAMAGLKGINLLNKLSEFSESTASSNKIGKSSISSEVLKDWLFSDTRKANDFDVVMLKDENNNINGLYVAVFLYKTSAGESEARTNLSDEMADDFARKTAEDGNYNISEKAVAKIGSFLYK